MQATGRKDPKIRRILKLRRKNKNRYGKRTIQDETINHIDRSRRIMENMMYMYIWYRLFSQKKRYVTKN